MTKKATLDTLYTRWGSQIDRDNPLPEYPRPQLVRERWQNLNGVWRYAILDEAPGAPPTRWDGDIVVPFSPESALSGVGRQLLPGQTLWYERQAAFEKKEGERILLHFGAVDQCCALYVNGRHIRDHAGGYWPFYADITEAAEEGQNTISLRVTDDIDAGPHAYGKQKLARGGIWYTAQSGIWQTVWAEYVPRDYITSLKITPLFDEGAVRFELGFSASPLDTALEILDGDTVVASAAAQDGRFTVALGGFKPWSPDDPFLYGVRIRAGGDAVQSYFGMRKFGITAGDKDFPVLALNNKPLFHSGLLDQGYWSDGMYTPPSDDAIVWEINQIRALGFNMVRKHIKIEPLRWYYHCDRLGLLVWQDFVNGGGPYDSLVTQALPFIGVHLPDGRYKNFGRADFLGRAQYVADMRRTVKLLYNAVSLALWVPFNEGWGQFDSARITGDLRALDPTRPIDSVSGWHDNGAGDFKSPHVYYRKFHAKPDDKGRALILSEFGGYSCPVAGHMASDKLFGYKTYADAGALSKAIDALYQGEVIPAREQGLCAAVYTQVSDVEDEINGLFTYDRAVVKPDTDTLRRINRQLLEEL